MMSLCVLICILLVIDNVENIFFFQNLLAIWRFSSVNLLIKSVT